MTTTYDPHHPEYVDEADVRGELSRVFDVCGGCRRCLDLCSSFPTLFEMLDQHDEIDAGRLTPAQQDEVVDACTQCQLCALKCPYTPALHELSVDVPRLMLRAEAMRVAQGHVGGRRRLAARVLGRTDLVGKMATTVPTIANRVVTAAPGSLRRRIAARLTGVSATRLLPRYADERFSRWFANRPRITLGKKQGTVTVAPTCLVEYQATEVGKDLVRVYERNGIECRTSGAGCCGAPSLHAGDVERFTKVAEKNVAMLAAEVRMGTDIVVPQPTCGLVIKQQYAAYVGEAARADAELVAEHTFDAAEYLMKLHSADDTVLDTDFSGDVPDRITYHAPSHLRARGIGFKSRDLLKLTGARVTLVQQSAGIDGLWGLRAGAEQVSDTAAQQLGERIGALPGDAIAGDCHLANTVIAERTGRRPTHPIQVIARAYGFPPD